jgi:hypothetical protein
MQTAVWLGSLGGGATSVPGRGITTSQRRPVEHSHRTFERPCDFPKDAEAHGLRSVSSENAFPRNQN